MEEIGVIEMHKDDLPADYAEFQTILLDHGFDGEFYKQEGFLYLENEDGVYEFTLYGAGIEVNGAFEDVAATIIDLQEFVQQAFPGAEFSSGFDY